MEAARAYAERERMFDPVSAGARACVCVLVLCVGWNHEPSQISESEIAKAFAKGGNLAHRTLKAKFGAVCLGVLKSAIAAAKDDESEEGGERESGKKAKRG